MSKKELNFKNKESLVPVEKDINEAKEFLNDKNRVISDSSISDVLAGVVGVGIGGVTSFAALYFGGTVGLSAVGITSGLAAAGAVVGGGMLSGIAVLAAPAVILGGAALKITDKKRKQLQNKKEELYNIAIRKQTLILEELQSNLKTSEERIAALTALNILLQNAIKDLGEDLGKKA